MTDSPRKPVFVERSRYRQRRLADLARILPIFGLVLWVIPLLWNDPETIGTATRGAGIYIFGVWVLLIALSALLGRAMPRDTATPSTDQAG